MEIHMSPVGTLYAGTKHFMQEHFLSHKHEAQLLSVAPVPRFGDKLLSFSTSQQHEANLHLLSICQEVLPRQEYQSRLSGSSTVPMHLPER